MFDDWICLDRFNKILPKPISKKLSMPDQPKISHFKEFLIEKKISLDKRNGLLH